jgi:hypothetical protein
MERMRSGVMQRWFALILVLCFSLGSAAIVHRNVLAADATFTQPLDPPLGGGAGSGGGSAAGDPDQPQSPSAGVGGSSAGLTATGSRVRGDNAVLGSRGLWRFGVVWMGLRGYWLHL